MYAPADPAVWQIWRVPLGGDHGVRIGAFGAPADYYTALEWVGDRLLTYQASDFQGTPWALTKAGDGFAVASLPAWVPGEVLGIADDGSLMWSRITGGNSSTREERVEFGRQAPGDGEVRSFWTDKPPSVEPRSYWPDGSGGGFVSAVEWSTGNSKRNTIWTLDGDGQAPPGVRPGDWNRRRRRHRRPRRRLLRG